MPFHTIAVPHSDILDGRLTLDVFAADLWEVFEGRAPDEYKDPTQFFEKTYQTDGLKDLLSIVEQRLKGQGGDPVIQIQTPFGGGKTHALIAMYHKAVDWNARKVVIVGTPMSPSDTLWGVLEKQLTGGINRCDGLTAPGRDTLRELLSDHQPVLILMDEVLEYITKAAGVPVADSTLAAQTLAFMQELTEVAAILKQVALVITLPSGSLERYGERAEQLFMQLAHVAGRVKKIYTPVQEHEIAKVIRQRLFSRIDMDDAAEVIRAFMDYADKEAILPPRTQPSEYRKRFEASYPFQPEVIDVLYQRWGSFPEFQRTRGVLRILSLVIHALKEQAIPYISLGDFDLGVQEIRQELLEHIGPQYDSVIAADITGEDAGARQVDNGVGDIHKGLKLGTRAATTIFLYSFSGGPEHGATLGEVKRGATTTGNPSSVVAEANNQLKGRLFYLQHDDGRAYFTNQPNLNRILLTRIENIDDAKVDDLEDTLLNNNLAVGRFKTRLEAKEGSEVPDDSDLKLVVLKKRDETLMTSILENKGKNTPRVNRNTVFFLVPLELEERGFYTELRNAIAYRAISTDKTLNLSDEQQQEVKTELRKAESGLDNWLCRYYRTVCIPTKEGFKETDLGIPTVGVSRKLDEVIYGKLKSDGELLEGIQPVAIKERYLKTDSVSTEQLYQSSAKTPGEARLISRSAWEASIREGVEQGIFGLGELEDGKPIYRYFKERPPSIALSGNEVIIREDICIAQQEPVIEDPPPIDPPSVDPPPVHPPLVHPPPSTGERNEVSLKFTIPKGQVSKILGVMNLLQSHFDNLEVELLATDGDITDQDYEGKIKETFNQLDIDLKE
jgi:hypothetical protein